jgi:YidC/Oxa1 family membrane protein insertase
MMTKMFPPLCVSGDSTHREDKNLIQTIVNLLRPVFERLEIWLGDWGLAVILFTLLVRTCLIPISLRQARLAANQFVFSRKAAELQKNWKGKKEELAGELGELARKYRFNPLGMMMNALVQSPIYISVYALFSHLGPAAHSALIPWVESIGLRDPSMVVPLGIACLNALLVRVSLIPREFTPKSGWFSSVLMWVISYLILWKAPVATALYYGTSGLWGAAERWLLSGRVRKEILAHLPLEEARAVPKSREATV